MAKEKNLVEDALIKMRNLEEAVAENAKGILASTMKQEIKDLVKESLNEQGVEDEEEVEVDTDSETEDADDEEEMEFDSEDSEDEDSEEDEVETDFEAEDDLDDVDMDTSSDEEDMDFDTDEDSDEETIDLTGVSDEELIKVFKAMKDEDGIIVKKDGDSVHLQDDGADVEYMIKLGESEEGYHEAQESWEEEMDEEIDESWEEEMDEEVDIEDVMDKILGPETNESLDEDLYEISLDKDDDELFEYDSEEFDEETDNELFEYDSEEFDEEMDDQNLFESKKSMTIKPKGKNIGSPKFSYKQSKGGFKESMPKGTRGVGMGKVKKSVFTQPAKKSEAKEGTMKPKGVGLGKGPKFEYKETTKGQMKKAETKEASRTLGNGKKWGRNGLDKPRTSPRHIQLESELNSLREKNEEYRKALNIFREKLNEVAVFNSNLAYATRLFTEHTTTKQEKLNILRRFDGVDSLKESKTLYKTIKNELGDQNKPMIKESIENKIEKVQQTGSSINLMESTTYQNPQFMRMKDLMSKLK